MNHIKFSKYGTFLSGRSLPKEIISKEGINPRERLKLDFENIPAANQSFLNQLFLDLALVGYTWEDLSIVNATSPLLTDRIEEQLDIVFDRKKSVKSN